VRNICDIFGNVSQHIFRKSMASSFRVGLRFCPLEYLKVMSRELHRRLDVSQLDCSSSEIVNASITHQINTVSIFDNNNHFESTFSATTSEKYKKATDDFISQVKSHSLLVFTDGSVCGKCPGCGACAAVLYFVE